MTAIGIHDLALTTTHHVVELDDVAADTGVDPAKFHIGLGQDRFSFPAPDEDIVTMAAAAAQQVIDRHGTDGIRTVLFGTESGVDQSKSAGVYLHKLLGLPARMRTVEIKQACYGATAALQAAVGMVTRAPDERVLVIGSDVARYALGSPGEPTQGAAAVAILVSANPDLIEIEPVSGVATDDIDDFWRPNDSSTAVVDGHLSMDAYLNSLSVAWDDFRARGGVGYDDIHRFVHHQPFTKMARKAQAHLAAHAGVDNDPAVLESSLLYNRELGNSYTASVFAGLAALLDHEDDLAGRRVGIFSYGSGSVSEFLTGIVQPAYLDARRGADIRAAIDARTRIELPAYRDLHAAERGSDADFDTPQVTSAPFRFAGVTGRARRYEATAG